jgi:hypothetical protein
MESSIDTTTTVERLVSHEGEIKLGTSIIPCYVLEDGTRVLSGRGMQTALKIVENPDDNSSAKLSAFWAQKSLNQFIHNSKTVGVEPIICYKGNQKINGYEATTLADICDAFFPYFFIIM